MEWKITPTLTEGNNTQQTAGNSTEAKTFTQEEVNRIVQERLAKKRRGTGQTIEERELDLTRRENRMKCAERLSESGYPKELLDILIHQTLKRSWRMSGNWQRMQDPGAERSTDPAGGGRYPGALKDGEEADIRKAFGLD